MIPKIIHYCWFGRKEIPAHLQACMDTWKTVLPDYRIMRWDEDSFDVEGVPWTKEAYSVGKFAFVSDYVRLAALREYGGIYLDTDVKVLKSFDGLLENRAFLGFENELYLTSAVMGFEPGFPLLTEFLSHYDGRHFLQESGELADAANVIMMTDICRAHGLAIQDMRQNVADALILPREYFCPLDFYHNDHSTENSVTIHLFDASWLERDHKKKIRRERAAWYKAWIQMKTRLRNLLRSQ